MAPRLLGAILRHGGVTLRIIEVEAYGGSNDPGSHAYKGERPRNRAQFGPAGRFYVYRSHGIHYCANLVTGEEGNPDSVLLRAGEVIDGLSLARERRGRSADRDLARGPGRLGQALGFDLDDNGRVPDLAAADERPEISAGPRVGLTQAADLPWRFWVTDDSFVSPYRRSPRAPER